MELDDIFELISEMDGDELHQVLNHVLFYLAELFPQWSVSVISMDKCEDKTEQIDRMIAFLEKMKDSPDLMEPRFVKM